MARARASDFAIVGAAAFLAVTLSAPVTSIALLVEFTHTGAALIVPMMLAVAAATLTARVVQGRPTRGFTWARWTAKTPHGEGPPPAARPSTAGPGSEFWLAQADQPRPRRGAGARRCPPP